MARKTNTQLHKQGKVRGISNQDIDSLKESLKHFNYNKRIESDASED